MTHLTDAHITELAAIGAAVGSNCEPCLTYHYEQSRALGLSDAHISLAIRTAEKVKQAPAKKIRDLATELLDRAAKEPAMDAGGCCGGGATADVTTSSSPEVTTTGSGCC